ncbi:hypothetical protein SPRG_22251 [Saprolegnia parasitica CBS 223.65]|uniref:Uncharacterized protein n=1 Tax=Saprolegnia parasitica (strain CBS 223.65) TaxID=695850 RepID=A0A067CDS6_SAPPC|nr:hypothetical protein SPRG_22251 [Saprolegnia parasitica CBS 223.65]KDO24977.1 hypothetical protein SPRG_22251 [Saprolegnia parasitica CBS 223.65]|eukprot:XP_012204326.1 hypothetical protein SPRG_22251 [Saprolegnia parasitica CBS 223.65]
MSLQDDRVASLREEEETKDHVPESGTGRSWRGAPRNPGRVGQGYGQRPSYAAAVNGVQQRAAQALRHTFVRLLPEPAAIRELIERNTLAYASFDERLALMKTHLPILPVVAKVPVWLKGGKEFANYSNQEITDEFFSANNNDVWMPLFPRIPMINKTNDGSLVFSVTDHETRVEMLHKSVELFGDTYKFTASADEERAALLAPYMFMDVAAIRVGFEEDEVMRALDKLGVASLTHAYNHTIKEIPTNHGTSWRLYLAHPELPATMLVDGQVPDHILYKNVRYPVYFKGYTRPAGDRLQRHGLNLDRALAPKRAAPQTDAERPRQRPKSAKSQRAAGGQPWMSTPGRNWASDSETEKDSEGFERVGRRGAKPAKGARAPPPIGISDNMYSFLKNMKVDYRRMKTAEGHPLPYIGARPHIPAVLPANATATEMDFNESDALEWDVDAMSVERLTEILQETTTDRATKGVEELQAPGKSEAEILADADEFIQTFNPEGVWHQMTDRGGSFLAALSLDRLQGLAKMHMWLRWVAATDFPSITDNFEESFNDYVDNKWTTEDRFSMTTADIFHPEASIPGAQDLLDMEHALAGFELMVAATAPDLFPRDEWLVAITQHRIFHLHTCYGDRMVQPNVLLRVLRSPVGGAVLNIFTNLGDLGIFRTLRELRNGTFEYPDDGVYMLNQQRLLILVPSEDTSPQSEAADEDEYEDEECDDEDE